MLCPLSRFNFKNMVNIISKDCVDFELWERLLFEAQEHRQNQLMLLARVFWNSYWFKRNWGSQEAKRKGIHSSFQSYTSLIPFDLLLSI